MTAQDLFDALGEGPIAPGEPAEAARLAGFIDERGELTRDGALVLLMLRTPERVATAAALLAIEVVADADRRAVILGAFEDRHAYVWPTSLAGYYLTGVSGGVRCTVAASALLTADAAIRARSASKTLGSFGHVAGLVFEAVTLGAATWREVGLMTGFEEAVIGFASCPSLGSEPCNTHDCPFRGRLHDAW